MWGQRHVQLTLQGQDFLTNLAHYYFFIDGAGSALNIVSYQNSYLRVNQFLIFTLFPGVTFLLGEFLIPETGV